MTQALPKLVNFEEFVEWLPENSAVRYELHNRNIIEIIQPVGEHQEVTAFLRSQLLFKLIIWDCHTVSPTKR